MRSEVGALGRDAGGPRPADGEPRKASNVLGVLIRAASIASGLGILAALLYVAFDPHLRPHFGPSLARSAPRMVAGFAVAGVLLAGIGIAFTDRPWTPLLHRALAALLPEAGLALTVLASPVTPWTLTPKAAGAIVTGSDLVFVLTLAVLALATAVPTARWIGFRPGGVPDRWQRLAPVPGALAIGAFLAVSRLWSPGPEADMSVSGSPARRVVVIAIDGADWREIHPLVERGLLPAIGSLIETGASGELSTFRPTLSPMIWTTVATGQPPLRHGILDFREPGSGTPYTSNTRRVPALWNLLGERGIPVGVVGWWVTWPAEAVNGHLVSAYSTVGLSTIKGTLFERLDRQTHPPELMAEIEPLIEPALEEARDELASILEGYAPPPEDVEFSKRLRVASWVLSADRIFSWAAIRIAEKFDPRFLAVYLSAVDENSHVFCNENPWRDTVCGRVLERVYASVDRQVGAIIEAMGPDATVILLSDHGFERARGHMHGLLHGPPGILILKGPEIRAGATIRAASIYDLTPTVLALFGVPVARDLRGRVLLSAFEPDVVDRGPSRSAPADDPTSSPTTKRSGRFRPRPTICSRSACGRSATSSSWPSLDETTGTSRDPSSRAGHNPPDPESFRRRHLEVEIELGRLWERPDEGRIAGGVLAPERAVVAIEEHDVDLAGHLAEAVEVERTERLTFHDRALAVDQIQQLSGPVPIGDQDRALRGTRVDRVAGTRPLAAPIRVHPLDPDRCHADRDDPDRHRCSGDALKRSAALHCGAVGDPPGPARPHLRSA